MPLVFPSADWASAYRDAINANALYKKSAAGWDQGAIAFVCKPDAALGIDGPQAIILDLHQGECRGVQYATDTVALASTPFIIEASYAQWKSVISGQIDPIKAMLQGQLRLTKGHLPTIIRDVEGSKQLVLSAGAIETQFLG
jgi:putative sterol carrier protein